MDSIVIVVCSIQLDHILCMLTTDASALYLDIAIILLPVISFLRALRLLRLGRIAQLNKMTRLYRARGLATKLRQTLILMGLAEKSSLRLTQHKIDSLEEQLEERLEQVEDLRNQIAQLQEDFDRRSAPHPDLDPTPKE